MPKKQKMNKLYKSTEYITYTIDSTTYNEINTTFHLPDKEVKRTYHTICTKNGYTIKCSKYDYTAYSIWKGKSCYEDRIESLERAKEIVKEM
jgi:hypothetical protein